MSTATLPTQANLEDILGAISKQEFNLFDLLQMSTMEEVVNAVYHTAAATSEEEMKATISASIPYDLESKLKQEFTRTLESLYKELLVKTLVEHFKN